MVPDSEMHDALLVSIHRLSDKVDSSYNKIDERIDKLEKELTRIDTERKTSSVISSKSWSRVFGIIGALGVLIAIYYTSI